MEKVHILPSCLSKTECSDSKEDLHFVKAEYLHHQTLQNESDCKETVVRETSHNESSNDKQAQALLLKCDVCSYETTNETNFAVHKKVHRKMFRCDSCRYVCGSEGKLWNHKKKLHLDLEDLLYFCGDCAFTSEDRASFKKHRQEEHKKEYIGRLFCRQCDFKTDNPRMLQRHAKTHMIVKKKLIQCPKCDFKSINKRGVSAHRRKVHAESYFKCHICRRNFGENEEKEFKGHMDRHNWPVEDGKFMCKLCDYSAVYMQSIVKHIKVIHEGKVLNYVNTEYKCDLCPYTTSRRLRIGLHRMNHTKVDDQLRCLQCTYVAFTSATLEKHYQKAHGGEKVAANFNCDKCEYKGQSLRGLKAHRKTICSKPLEK